MVTGLDHPVQRVVVQRELLHDWRLTTGNATLACYSYTQRKTVRQTVLDKQSTSNLVELHCLVHGLVHVLVIVVFSLKLRQRFDVYTIDLHFAIPSVL
ncbi:unnamed protein product [Macrosiphum euphorbiae]|uniref:Uncharacterized protein n=1 Tax=Macrosiphum euphorbiae TaxID=13131 RepID=A0AAV0W1C3_9HEMI|nr:unnamed protein product [Macrosiphum euphorbiae]